MKYTWKSKYLIGVNKRQKKVNKPHPDTLKQWEFAIWIIFHFYFLSIENEIWSKNNSYDPLDQSGQG